MLHWVTFVWVQSGREYGSGHSQAWSCQEWLHMRRWQSALYLRVKGTIHVVFGSFAGRGMFINTSWNLLIPVTELPTMNSYRYVINTLFPSFLPLSLYFVSAKGWLCKAQHILLGIFYHMYRVAKKKLIWTCNYHVHFFSLSLSISLSLFLFLYTDFKPVLYPQTRSIPYEQGTWRCSQKNCRSKICEVKRWWQ